MAEKDVERKVRIYRSVSFKKLGNWNAKAFSEEGGTELPGKGDVTQPTCQKTHRPPARSLSLTRKVSKISSASKDQNIPSVRQISHRFSPHQRDDGAVSDDENLRSSDHRFPTGACEGNSIVEPSQGTQQDFINPTGSDGLSLALPGKSHDFHSPSSWESPSSGISLDEVDTFCSFLHQPDNRELFVTEGTNWPSVTEMRKLFGDSTRKAPSRASSLPDCEEPKPGSYVREMSGMEPQKYCPIETATAKNFNHYTKDQPSGPSHLPKNPSSKLESNYCRTLSESKNEQYTLCLDTKEHQNINTGPKPQPPPPPPRSCIPFGLKSHTLSSGLPKQEARQQSLSLHSWHSSGKPQTAPDNVRLKDSYSMDELQRNTMLPTMGNKSGSKIRSQEPSSGSDEEDGFDVLRESLRKRSTRKENYSLVCDDKDLDEGGYNIVNVARDLDQGSSLSDFLVQKLVPSCLVPSVSSDAYSPELSTNVSTTIPHETPKRNSSEAVTPGQLASVSPMPTVSRVAKVNIPPFMQSPCGSRSSSRYSSTETLKDDDHFNAYYAGQARNLQGGYNVHRSPSFGQHESMSRPLVRSRSKISCSVTKPRNEIVNDGLQCDLESEDAKHKKSRSNPDITSDTLSLLSYLKPDFSDFKLKNRGPGTSEKEGACSRLEACQETSGQPSLIVRGRPVGQNRLQQGSRPTLKDLTATLRRTKSFTYSEKLGSRRVTAHSSMKQSSSELMLATLSNSDGIFSHTDVANNVKENYNEPEAMQDKYIQEARQVFEKIKQIGSQEDYSFDQEVIEHLKNRKRPDVSHVSVTEDGDGKCIAKCTSNEIGSDRKTSDLSVQESSLTDEGIVTEVDPAPCTSYRDLGQKLKVWKSTEMYQEENEILHAQNGDYNTGQSHTSNLDSTQCSDAPQMDAPPTPGTVRRRRKFPSLGNSGTDSSSGSNGESGIDAYRSLSDPMPHRSYSITEDDKKFSMDSNLLGSLNSKSGISDSSATALSECTGSAASVLSFSSDGVKDYNTVIQNIVSQPGALDKVIDEKGNGKTIKKKSFSDPSRRGELSPAEDSNEPSKELEQAILASTSEPILSEQRDELEELDEIEEEAKFHNEPEHSSSADLEENGLEGSQSLSFDPNLVNVLSPRVIRRSFKKRSNRIGSHDSNKEGEEPKEAFSKIRQGNKHIRHTSEPATFIPIAPPECKVLVHGSAHLTNVESTRPTIKQHPVLITPLEDVSKPTSATPSSSNNFNLMDLPRTAPSTPTTTELKPLRVPKPLEETGNRNKPNVDMRKHVFLTLLDTEQSYVESLRTLMEGYMKPLKQPENSFLCDPSLVDEIFDHIPELLEHHEQFLEQVSYCMQNWADIQTVGDILGQSFSKEILVSIYSAYIDNFLNAKDAVRIAKEARPAFIKFLEQCTRENKEKQALSDLMIKPVQRIPRYELIVKDLLKHTPEDHPDHLCLLGAQRNIKQLAERINKGMRSAEEAERDTRILQEIEAHIEGMEDLPVPFRRFVRQEMVVEVKAVGGKKDRSLFLFTDLLLCTTLKRKSGSLRRSSMNLYTAASVIDIASKYKLLWKLPLEDVDVVKGTSQTSNRDSIQKSISRLDEDLSTMGQISKLSETLSFPHQTLDDVIKDMMASVHRDLAEKQSLSFSMSFPPNKVELTTTKADGTESFIFEFSNPDARLHFEQAFEDAKKKLATSKNRLDPEFLKAIPIMKTRSGMQFSCASPSQSSPDNMHEVWVCNSDGYVGQVCLLSIRNEPTVEACIAVCSARILCIASVPGLKRNYSRERPPAMANRPSEQHHTQQHLDEPPSQQCLHISISGSSLELSENTDSRELVPFDSDDTDDESSPSPSGTLQSQASRSTISSSFGNEEMTSAKDTTAETTSSEEEQEAGFLPIPSNFNQNRDSESPTEGSAVRRSSRGSFTRGSLEDLLSIDPEAYQSSMWLGTEDGCIHVYQSSDNIRNRKNSMKMQHAAAVMCILYLDNQVFVSVANGDVIVYQREAGSFWDSQNSKILPLGSPGSPITKMVSISGKLWCGCQNRVIILNTSSLLQEHTFHIGQDQNRCVTCMVTSNVGMWIALQGSAQVRLYHATTFEQLSEVDIAPPVHKMLAGSDAIIRQHKSACLRITALLACKDLLWIGTSAGVVLTLTITSTTSSSKGPISPVGLSQGHTGHVRFLTSVELPDGFDVHFPLPVDQGNEQTCDTEKRDSTRHRPKSKLLVISGGDGYEDFRLTSSSETVGRDDSTNHLLLWRV
ncbi:rho guanine nucleotide exchange factor 17 [Ranitomeya imitator]|uniref:rho guanine nucleotide exchange factor 17 n=1 Tax=Ranitomeya imitator TaxID=111125 RepID=UPI0037E96020